MKKIPSLLILSLSLAMLGCPSNKATTAQEFVRKHSKAYYFRDAKAVAEMTLCAEDSGLVVLPEHLREELRAFPRDSLVRALREEMKEQGCWVAAWRDTRYAGEREHGGHIHVDVKVGYAASSIVLVKVGKHLKIALNPSSFE